MVSQNHFDNDVAEAAEIRKQFRKHEKIGDRVGKTTLGNIFHRRYLPSVGFTDEDDPSGAQAPRQKLDYADRSSFDLRGADAGRHIDLLVGNVAGSIAMDKLDSIGDTELFSTALRLLVEQPAHVDAGADDVVVTRPSAQHFSRTAAEVEHPGLRFQAQRRIENGELLGCDRVVDTVSAFGDVEDPWNIHFRVISLWV
ncbi:hypothetical protein MFUM_310010 [Methylacidiphilum fumariolicum SolV]|uniref:Uncharacterized protein n=2 Tax=Candidatus Methylacidiphilum fumarolicum TaxID=591154 RepID=I0JXX0_METFB|nr:conserved protein of unknown function [Candidatus Methylacidiphilum fumarolicum]CCG92089.1 hypothetical protein MFUM_310010 [Methylacidiphilum fumariolicum SolV]